MVGLHENINESTFSIKNEIGYKLFGLFTLIISAVSVVFSFINWFNQRPPVNILTGFAIVILTLGCHLMARSERLFTAARLLLLSVIAFVWIPFGYLTSPGSQSAMPYLIITATMVMTVIARNNWEYLFPVAAIVITPILFYFELNNPELFPAYADESFRVRDIAINFTAAISAVLLSTIAMAKRFQTHSNEVYELSIRDGLTGAFNRRFFTASIAAEHSRSMRTNSPYSLVFIDLNNFKKINDQKGHLTGDEVLRTVSSLIQKNIRDYDYLARYGGDEFIIVFPETTMAEAQKRMDIINQLLQPLIEQYKKQSFAIAYGISDSRGKTIEQVLQEADNLLYKKKGEMAKA